MKGDAYFYGKALRLPGESVYFLPLAMGYLLLICVLIGLCVYGILFYVSQRKQRSVFSALAPLCAVAAFFIPTGDLYLRGIKNRLMQIDEAAYLDFAQKVRTAMGDVGLNRYVTLDRRRDDQAENQTDGTEAVRRIVDESVFSIWPNELLLVFVEDHSVSVRRGSGMLGDMGIEIFDRGTPPAVAELTGIPYKPYGRRYDDLGARRVFFFRAD